MKSQNTVVTIALPIFFWGFIGVKLWGVAFAAWSWWWVLLPIIPWIWFIVTRLGV